MAMWAMTVLVAPVAGPLLGGWITDNISWPWIFYINIPVGMIAAAITWSIYRKRDPGSRKSPFDAIGLALLVIWVGALQIMVDKGKELDWFGSTQIVVLALVAVIGFAFFLAWELTEEHPIVDLRLFARAQLPDGNARALGRLRPLLRQRRAAAALAAAVHGLHGDLGRPRARRRSASSRSSSRRGWARTSPRSTRASSRRSPSSASASCSCMRSHFNVQADFRTIMIPTVLQGAAMAFFFIPLQAIIFSGLTPDRMPAAAGLSNFVRITAGAIGTSIFTTAVGEPRRACTTPSSPRRSTTRATRRPRRSASSARAGSIRRSRWP